MRIDTRLSLLAGAACALATVLPVPRAHADTLVWGSTTYTYSSTQAGTNAVAGTVGTTPGGNNITI